MDADSGRHLSKLPRWKVSVAWSADDRLWREADTGQKQAELQCRRSAVYQSDSLRTSIVRDVARTVIAK
jgi:hypothetical protein